MISTLTTKDVQSFFQSRYWWFIEANMPGQNREKDERVLRNQLNRVQDRHRRIRRKIMASKKKSQNEYKWLGYLNIYLPDDQMEAAAVYMKDSNAVWADFTATLADEITFKIFFDKKADAFKCTMLDYNPDSPNFGYATSSFGSDWFSALAVALFKHVQWTDGDWQFRAGSTNKKFG